MFPTTSIDWLKKLIAFDTTSRYSNLELIEYVAQYLKQLNVPYVLSYDDSKSKANLFATIAAANGQSHEGGIVLSGHTDVVPVDGQDWHSDPFNAEIREGKLYGRGSCDMKGFIAVVLAKLPSMLQQPLKNPLHIALSYDEEVGCIGAPRMIAQMQELGIKPSGCIVGEPTNMRTIVAHKSINTYRCVFHGCAAHSSLTPQGTNAIEYAAKLICYFRDLVDSFKKEGPFDEFFDVPFTTGQTSLINGGIAINTVPDLCEMKFEYRALPTVDTEAIIAKIKAYIDTELVPAMKSENEKASVELEAIASSPALDALEQAAITQLVRELTRDDKVSKVAYATEAGLFQQVGVPTIVCGPGDIAQAHRANEFITLEQMESCERFIDAFCQTQLHS